jgi:hypothetical protein
MKKVLLSMSLMAMGLFFAACTNSAPKAADAAAEGATEAATEVKEAAEEATVSIGDLKALVESATKDGANWTEAQWKDAFKTVMKAAKPLLVTMKDMQEKEKNASEEEKLKMATEMMDKLKEYKDVGEQFEAFSKAAEKSEIGKKLSDDKAFQKELEKDLGFEEGFFDSI